MKRSIWGVRKQLLTVAGLAALTTPILLVVINGPTIRAQALQAAKLEFEVASVKPFKPGSEAENRRITVSYGSLTMRQQTLRDCIAWAYDVQAGDVKGPASVDLGEYDIDARAAESATQGQLKLMLQSLLVERFRLALHHVAEQRQLYVLILGKGGPKLHEVRQEPSRGGAFSLNGGVFTKHFVTNMPQLAEMLPMFLDHSVLDKTGLTGVYDFTLKVEMGADVETRMPGPGQMFYGFGMTPGIFQALEELGLKLVSQKGPVDILVIDHVERPSEN